MDPFSRPGQNMKIANEELLYIFKFKIVSLEDYDIISDDSM